MLQLKHKNTTYLIRPHQRSTWKTVYKDNEHLGLVMNERAAFQVVYSDIKKTDVIKFLVRADFKEIK